jgi:hypothetical protein
MKKILFALFVLAISSQVFAEITVKQVLGDWKYVVNTDQGALTGVIRLTEKEGKLAGIVITDDGNTYAVSKLEIKDENILYFEIVPEYNIIKVTLKIDGKKFTGTVGNDQGEIPITGEKKNNT